MIEFIQFAFAPANAFFSVLTALMFLYWIVAAIGVLDLEFLDFDIDLDMEVEGEIEADAVSDVGGAFNAFMAFFYVGQVPVTILLSILVFSMWVLAMATNAYVNPTGGFWLGLPVAGGSILAGLLSVKVLGWPFGKLFSALHANPNELKDVVGKLCVVTTSQASTKRGQAEVQTQGAPILINCITENGEVLHKGDEAVILEHKQTQGVYVIAPVDLETRND